VNVSVSGISEADARKFGVPGFESLSESDQSIHIQSVALGSSKSGYLGDVFRSELSVDEDKAYGQRMVDGMDLSNEKLPHPPGGEAIYDYDIRIILFDFYGAGCHAGEVNFSVGVIPGAIVKPGFADGGNKVVAFDTNEAERLLQQPPDGSFTVGWLAGNDSQVVIFFKHKTLIPYSRTRVFDSWYHLDLPKPIKKSPVGDRLNGFWPHRMLRYRHIL